MSAPAGAAGRRLFLDLSAGEARGVVALDGRPERLLIERAGEPAPLAVGARALARVRRIERGLATAFLDLGEGGDAVLALAGPAAGLAEGRTIEVEVSAPARRGKRAAVRLLGPAEGPPRVLTPAPPIEARLQAFAPGATIVRGSQARAAAELAEAQALATEHPLGGGASLAIETTRGLTAIDVDLGGAAGADPRRGAAKLNLLAIAQAARLLRLKALGGLVVFDLAGRGQNGEAAVAAARAAFASDMPGVVFGPVSKLGVFQLALPWRETPVCERLLDPDGGPSAAAAARRLARALEAEAARAVRLRGVCAPETARAFEAVAPALVERIGPRFHIVADPGRSRGEFEVRADG